MRKLLVIDDSMAILKAFKRALLGNQQFKPLFAKSYAEANKLLEEYDIYAAIVDLELPDCSSGGAVDLTLEHNIPTIVFTATINQEIRDEMLKRPICDYIVKRSIEDIRNAINMVEDLVVFEEQKVLIVDDSSTSRKEIKKHFELLTIECVEADSPLNALEILESGDDFTILSIDYIMPQMNGAQLIQQLRDSKKSDGKLIFGVTSLEDNLAKLGFLKSGAYDVFSKPLLKEEFNTKIANALKLVKQQEELKKYVDVVDKYIITSKTDSDGNIIYVSEAFSKASGYSREELIGKNHNIVRHEDMPKQIYDDMWSTITSGKSWSGELKNRKKDGSFYWVKTHIEPIFNKSSQIVAHQAIRQDITDRKAVELMAITDRLTNIFNRIHLDAVLSKEVADSEKRGASLSVVILDIDKFKSVNDTYGHQVGDSVLKESANILKKTLGDRGVLGRWGGEEFLVILSDTDLDRAITIAEELRVGMEGFNFSVVGSKSASFGVSSFREGDSEESLLKRADDALYEAKKSGRNRVCSR